MADWVAGDDSELLAGLIVGFGLIDNGYNSDPLKGKRGHKAGDRQRD
jgi:hypothetical protein